MGQVLTATGATIQQTGSAYKSGQIKDNTKENGNKVSLTGTGNSTGLMVVNMRVVGRMESSMVLALILLRVVRLSRVSGPTEKDSTGFPIPRVSNE